jgi:ferric-dicitrate binding protein FerR (iron transport regulator)
MNREELFDRHLRGELTAAEAAELKRLLAHDPGAGRAFVEHANETALLVRVGSQIESTDNVVPLPSVKERALRGPELSGNGRKPGTRGVGRFRAVKWAALAACCVALAIAGILLSRKSPPPRIAEVYVTGPGVQVTRGGVEASGDFIELRAGDLITTPTNNLAVIAYGHEPTRIEIRPGSAVLFGDAARGKRFELHRGIIRASVAPQPAGQQMSVKTALARATVLGTEFVMRADERATKLDVLEGKVRLACRANGKKVTVKAGFSANVIPEAPVNVAPLCFSNCILRECIQSSKTKTSNEQ